MLQIFNYSKIIYNYIKLSYNILSIYYFKNDILNNKNSINNLIKNIENCGCMAIKITQWILPRLELIHNNNILINEFKCFYENTHHHSLKETNKIFKNELNAEITDNFKIIKLLGSGSIGQVYLVENIYNNEKYAIKINHPNIYFEYYIFYIFIKILLYFINYKNIIPLNNIDEFLSDFKNQLNLKNEANNNKKFQDLYKENNIFIIPKIMYSTKNILIMEYIQGDDYISCNNIYDRYKILLFMSLFIHNNAYNNYSHGDLHIGNWKIKFHENDYKIIIYDFGYCFNINREEYIILDDLVSYHNKKVCISDFLKYYINASYNKLNNYKYEDYTEDIDIICKKHYKRIESINKENEKDKDIVGVIISDVINLCIKKNLLLSTTCLNGLFIFLQFCKLFHDVRIITIENNKSKIIKQIYNICETYNVCHDLKKYLYNKINLLNIESDFNSINNDINKFECLNDLINNINIKDE